MRISPASRNPVVERRPRILFVAEAVTLAHISRPLALARALDPARCEVILATEPRYMTLWGDRPAATRPIRSITPEDFLGALARGRPPYDVATLRAYVRDDLKVIQETAPDVVIGDFRLSLAVSARVARVPYLAITNAYWSPHARRRIPLPELPLTRWLGLRAATALFRLAQPLAFAHHAAALNRVRKEYGLPGLGPDLRRIYTEADHVLYADIPELVPTFDRPAHHHYLGPIPWSVPVATPPWWHELPVEPPWVYVNLGSSGRGSLLSIVLDALASLPVNVLAADPGQSHQAPIPPNTRIAQFLPGGEAAARSVLVICNGGSPTTHQALAAGTPVLGLAGNMDQHLNMGAVQEYGAGRLVRTDGASPSAIRSAVALMLADPSYSEAASRVAIAFSRYDAPSRLRSLLSQVVGSPL